MRKLALAACVIATLLCASGAGQDNKDNKGNKDNGVWLRGNLHGVTLEEMLRATAEYNKVRFAYVGDPPRQTCDLVSAPEGWFIASTNMQSLCAQMFARHSYHFTLTDDFLWLDRQSSQPDMTCPVTLPELASAADDAWVWIALAAPPKDVLRTFALAQRSTNKLVTLDAGPRSVVVSGPARDVREAVAFLIDSVATSEGMEMQVFSVPQTFKPREVLETLRKLSATGVLPAMYPCEDVNKLVVRGNSRQVDMVRQVLAAMEK